MISHHGGAGGGGGLHIILSFMSVQSLGLLRLEKFLNREGFLKSP